MYKDIKFKLPIQQEYGKIFRIDDVTRDKVAIADDFLEKGAELYFQDVSEDRKTEFRLHLGNCGNLYF